MRKLTVGSCFSGIGGLELGLEWTGGFETKWQIEIDPYATKVLEKHWPKVRRYGDIATVGGGELERVDLICGGYPCQPFSIAGRRRGQADSRHLWPEMFRLIRDLRPRFALLENVPNHLRLGFDQVLGDLAEIGFDAEWDCIPAAVVGADHLRDRIFVLAYPPSERGGIFRCVETSSDHPFGPLQNQWGEKRNPRNCTLVGLRMDSLRRAAESGVLPMAHGIPNRSHRLRCIGNSVVPQVAQAIGEMILAYEGAPHE